MQYQIRIYTTHLDIHIVSIVQSSRVILDKKLLAKDKGERSRVAGRDECERRRSLNLLRVGRLAAASMS